MKVIFKEAKQLSVDGIAILKFAAGEVADLPGAVANRQVLKGAADLICGGDAVKIETQAIQSAPAKKPRQSSKKRFNKDKES